MITTIDAETVRQAVEPLLAKANGKRRARTLFAADCHAVALEALSNFGVSWRHGGSVDDARARTSLVMAVRIEGAVVLGIAEVSAQGPSPEHAWSSLKPWDARVPEANLARCTSWAFRSGADRVRLPLVAGAAPERSDLEGLRAAVLADPSDDTARMVLADALMESGDPRGEFISVQVALAKAGDDTRDELTRRQLELLDAHEDKWIKAVAPGAVSASWERGFLTGITAMAADFLELAPRLFALEPLTEVNLIDPNAELCVRIAALPELEHLRSLRIGSASTAWDRVAGWEGLNGLLSSRHLRGLKVLVLERQHLDDMGAMTLGSQGKAALPGLESLRITEDEIGPIGVEALMSERWFRHLSDVSLANNHLRDLGTEAIATAPGERRWKRLNLDGNLIYDPGARSIAASARLANVEELSLRGNHIGPAGAQVLIDSKHLKSLRKLELSGNRLGQHLLARVGEKFSRRGEPE